MVCPNWQSGKFKEVSQGNIIYFQGIYNSQNNKSLNNYHCIKIWLKMLPDHYKKTS